MICGQWLVVSENAFEPTTNHCPPFTAVMNALRVGNDYWINADEIVIVQPWPSRKASRERERAEAAQAFYDATVRQPIRSLATLQNGWVIASPLHPRALVRRRVVAAATISTLTKQNSRAKTRTQTEDEPTKAETNAAEIAHFDDENSPEETELIEHESSTSTARRWPFGRR